MKQIIKIGTHVIIGGACMLVVAQAFDNVWELLAYCLASMILGAVCCVIRQKELSFWVFIGSHLLLVLGGVSAISIPGFRDWYAVIWVVLILYSAILRLVPQARWLDEPGVVYVVFFTLIHMLICFLDGSVVVERASILAVSLLFLLYLLYRNLDSMDEFIMLQGVSTKVDEQGIRRLNNRLSLLYTATLGSILGLFSLVRVEKLWEILAGWLKKVIRYLLSLLPMTEQTQPEEKEEIKNGMSNMLHEMTDEQEPSIFMQVLGEIIRVVFTVLIVVGVIAAIVYAAIYIYRHFYNKQSRTDENKVIETLSYGDRITREKKTRFFAKPEQNPSRKIRKIYKKNMKRLGAKRISGFSYMLPEEQVKLLREQGTDEETIREIKSLYEKARYSSELLTDNEVDYMRRIM